MSLTRRSLFTGIAAAAIVPVLPRTKSPIVRGWDFGGRGVGGWGVYDDSFPGHVMTGQRVVYADGRYRLPSGEAL